MSRPAFDDLRSDLYVLGRGIRILAQINVYYGGIIARNALRSLARFISEVCP